MMMYRLQAHGAVRYQGDTAFTKREDLAGIETGHDQRWPFDRVHDCEPQSLGTHAAPLYPGASAALSTAYNDGVLRNHR